MPAGAVFTVTVLYTEHPPELVKVMTEVPEATPVTTPVPATTVATEVVPLLHVPVPGETSVVDRPTHTVAVPVIADGTADTLSIMVDWQPPVVYVMVVVPADRPATRPDEEPIDATDGVPLVHTPPVAGLVRVVVWPTQIDVLPEIGAGVALTVRSRMIEQPAGRPEV